MTVSCGGSTPSGDPARSAKQRQRPSKSRSARGRRGSPQCVPRAPRSPCLRRVGLYAFEAATPPWLPPFDSLARLNMPAAISWRRRHSHVDGTPLSGHRRRELFAPPTFTKLDHGTPKRLNASSKRPMRATLVQCKGESAGNSDTAMPPQRQRFRGAPLLRPTRPGRSGSRRHLCARKCCANRIAVFKASLRPLSYTTEPRPSGPPLLPRRFDSTSALPRRVARSLIDSADLHEREPTFRPAHGTPPDQIQSASASGRRRLRFNHCRSAPAARSGALSGTLSTITTPARAVY